MHGGEPVVDPAAQHPVDRLGLLEDLLVHVRVVAAHVPGLGLVLHRGGRGGGARALGGVGAEVVGLEGGHLAVVQGDDLAGVGDQGGDVGGDEHLLLADAEDDRGAVAGDDDPVREVGVQHGDAVGALDLADGLADLALQGVGLGAADEVGEDLGVGLGEEDHAVGGEPGAQVGGVVEDAVVDDGDLGVGVQVGVGVLVVGGAVGGPAGVRDADAALEAGRDPGLQVADAPLGLDRLQPGRLGARLAVDGDSGRVVTPVLQALEALQQQRRHVVATADVSHDSAHR